MKLIPEKERSLARVMQLFVTKYALQLACLELNFCGVTCFLSHWNSFVSVRWYEVDREQGC